LGSLLALIVCLALLLFLGTIIRFSFIGGARAKGLQKRLHRPELSEIESKWGVKLPDSLQKYYQSEIVARSDFYLAPTGTNPSEWWYIEGFLPLIRRDVSEWIAVTNAPGIPIALDASKGTYYIPFRSPRQRLPGRKREDRQVASSIEEFLQFEAKDVPDEEK
jgi:hypothetical protein